MTTIRIKNDSSKISDIDAMEYVTHVIRGGLISDRGTSYCGATVLSTHKHGQVVVTAKRTTTGHSFLVYIKAAA